MKHSLTYDHYFLYQEITDIMKDFAARYPAYTRLNVIGTSGEGRQILLMEITDTASGDFADKPAYYVEGNIHAGEVTGSMTVMYLMDTLLSNPDDPQIAGLLKKKTFYLLPRVSPDGSEYYLTHPDTLRSVPRMYPYEEEMPGLQPEDLDGDGAIRCMRVKSPYGVWKKSSLDPRLMVRRRPDEEEGEFYHIYQEGRILGYDGLQVKDAPAKFGYDFNRCYPIGWERDYRQNGAGEFPMINPETRANADFLLAHPNVCSCVDMHTSGGLILYTPGYTDTKGADPADVALYRALGQMASEESGYPLLQLYEEFMPRSYPATHGGFDDFCHFIIGIPAITIECWDLKARAGIPRDVPPLENMPDAERERREYRVLQWLDANLPAGEGFKDWTPFDHPQLGPVEIGGVCSKFVEQNPPIPFLEQELAKHVRFMLREAKALPDLVFDAITTERLSDGLYKVEAVVGNRGFMPSYVFKEALKNRKMKPLSITLEGFDRLVEGSAVTGLGHLEGFSSVGTMNRGYPARSVEKDPVRKKATWIVRAAAGTKLTLTCSGDKIGKLTGEIVLE